MKNRVTLGVIGAGRIGSIHAQNCSALSNEVATLAAISDVHLKSAQSLGQSLQLNQIYEDYQSILADDAIDAVIICSPTDSHAEIIEAAARAGKHIFCEKPIDLEVSRIKQCLKAVEAAQVILQVGFNRRFDPQFSHVAARIAQGDIGQPHLVRITSRDPAPPSAEYATHSGGMFLDMTIHDFDMARFLINEEVVQVYAQGANLFDAGLKAAGDLDTAAIQLTYASGAFCTIDNSRKATYGYDQRIEVFGAQGCLDVPNLFSYQATLWNESGGHRSSPHHFFLERYADSYRIELEAFIDSIATGNPVPVDGQDGLEAVYLSKAAQLSFKENRVVQLSEIRNAANLI